MAEKSNLDTQVQEADDAHSTLISTNQLLPIDQLFNQSWFPSPLKESSPCHHSKKSAPATQSSTIDFLKKYVPLLLYCPIGFLLIILRLCILLQFLVLVVIYPRSALKQRATRFMCFILGITYTTEGYVAPLNTSEKHVFISNYITILDSFVIHLVTNSVSPLKNGFGIPAFILKGIGFTLSDLLLTDDDISDSQQSLTFFPEVEPTNGQAGLLAFERLLILDDSEVVPIALKVSRSLLNVNTVQNGLVSELFLCLFLPNTHFVLRFLPSQPWNPQNVQECIGTSLKLLPTRYNASDKHELVKKINFRPPSITTMARLVQQQLHPVIISTETILNTLQRTGSVEKTVEELRKSMAEPSFHKSANERMMNFQERKRAMIANARRKYCEKHGLEF